jgi:HKD family nuclease
MINPRMFCREKGYTKAIGLTYSFDPLFFERVILRDLWNGQSTDITIIGDIGQLQKAVSDCSTQLLYLGKKYLIAPAVLKGTFHPKMLLRVGSKGAKIMMGSNNLTYGGWGGNSELAFTIDLEATPESAFLIASLLKSISAYILDEAVIEATERLQEFEWFSTRQTPVDDTIVITNPKLSLADEVLKRWNGRRFDTMLVFTGSTDDKGAFIRWCYEKFGIKKCILAISDGNSSLQPELVETIPVDINVAFFKSKPLHAKFYWFEGLDGQAAIVGSANCSAAAWLLSPDKGGNVEAIYIHNNPNPDDFQHILSLLPENHVSITQAPKPINITEGEKSTPPYLLLSVTLNRALCSIVASVLSLTVLYIFSPLQE